jgi:HlyD family secretion protein
MVLLLVSISLSGCAVEPTATADPAEGAVTAQQRGAISRGEFRQVLLLSGTLQARNSDKIIVPRMPDWETTIRWMTDDGAPVIEGEPLLELDTAQLASEIENKITAQQQALNALDSKHAEIAGQLAEKQFAFEQRRVALRKAEIAADVPLEVTDRKSFQEALLALQQAQVEFDKAQADLDAHAEASEAELEVLRVDLRKTEREVAEARQAIETMVLRAPQSGIAVASENRREDRKFQVGDTVSIGTTVMEIPDLGAMAVEARLSDVDDGKVTPGMVVTCTLDAYPERQFRGVVRELSPVAQESGWRSEQRHFLAHIDLDEADREIMQPGMSVRVEVETAANDDVLLVPRHALEFMDSGVRVTLAGGAQEPVELGPCNARVCVLRDGPAEGVAVESPR